MLISINTHTHQSVCTHMYIHININIRIILHFRGQVDRLFAAFKDQKVGGTLIGQIFEHLVLEALQSRKIVSFTGRSLRIRINALTPQESTINFGDFNVLNYNIMRGDLSDLGTLITDRLDKNRLLLPIQLNSPSVDAVFYNIQTSRLYFFQITISLQHPFNYLHVTKLANALEQISISSTLSHKIFTTSSDSDFRWLKNYPGEI